MRHYFTVGLPTRLMILPSSGQVSAPPRPSSSFNTRVTFRFTPTANSSGASSPSASALSHSENNPPSFGRSRHPARGHGRSALRVAMSARRHAGKGERRLLRVEGNQSGEREDRLQGT